MRRTLNTRGLLCLASAAMVSCAPAALSQDKAARRGRRREGPTAGVHELLDSIESSWAEHDKEKLSGLYSDEGTLFIIRPGSEGPTGVMTKAQAIPAVVMAWERAGVRSHRLMRRNIRVYGDVAWMSIAERNEFTDGRKETFWSFKAALQRNGKWQMCFSMPLIFRPVVLVTGTVPGSQAERLGIRTGDIVASYAGQRVQDTNTLIDLVKSRADGDASGKLRLVTLRGRKKIPLDVAPGGIGVQVANRLLPTRETKVVTADEPHAIKDLLCEELEALKAGELDGYVARFFCPTALLGFQPRQGQPTRILTLANVEDAIREQAPQMGAMYRLETARFVAIRLIVDGDVAALCGQFAVEPKDSSAKTIKAPIGLKVYVRLNGKWGMAAAFPGNVDIGRQVQ